MYRLITVLLFLAFIAGVALSNPVYMGLNTFDVNGEIIYEIMYNGSPVPSGNLVQVIRPNGTLHPPVTTADNLGAPSGGDIVSSIFAMGDGASDQAGVFATILYGQSATPTDTRTPTSLNVGSQFYIRVWADVVAAAELPFTGGTHYADGGPYTVPATDSDLWDIQVNPTSAIPTWSTCGVAPAVISVREVSGGVIVDPLNFGSTLINTSINHTIRISNNGGSTLYLAGASTTGDYSNGTVTSSIAAGGYSDVTLTFTPTVSGTRTGTFSFSHNAAGSPYSLNLTGAGNNPTLTLTRPRGSEVYVIGQVDTIKWSQSDLTGNVSVELNTNYPSGIWTSLGTVAASTGYVTWTPLVSQTSAGSARIRVTSINIPAVCDTSDANFGIYTVPTALNLGVVSYYPFNGSVADNSGFSNNLTPLYMSYTTDRFDRASSAASFNGSTTRTWNVNPSFVVNRSSSFTVSTWVKFNTTTPTQTIMLLGPATTGYMDLILDLNSTGTLRWAATNNVDPAISVQSGIAAGLWNHVAAVYDQGKLTLYINGTSVGTINYTYTASTATASPMTIGAYYSGTASNHLNGVLDEMRMYNRALTPSEIGGLSAQILVTKPNGSNVNVVGQPDSVKWSQLGVTGNVYIELNTNYPSGSWTSLGTAAASTGYLLWTPQSSQASTTARFRVTSVNNSSISDTSDANFNIYTLQQALTQGLVAYYPLNGNALDYSGNGYTGVASYTSNTTDRYGSSVGAFAFDGASSYVDVPNSNAISFQSLTVSAWVNRIGSSTIITKDRVGPSGDYTFVFEVSSTGAVSMTVRLSTGTSLTLNSVSNISTNTWYHLVSTYDGTSIKLYINGTLNTSVSTGNGLSEATTRSFSIGSIKYTTASHSNFFNGSIDEVRAYNRVLSAAEITALYQGVGVSRPNGGDVFVVGQQDSIKWGQTGVTGNVNIELNTNYPSGSWTSLGTAAASTGYMTWTPQLSQISTTARIRVTSVNNSAVGDTGDGNFGIYTAQMAINQGLVAYYQLNGDVTDNSGQGNNLTPSSITYTTDQNGIASYAASFNGTSSYGLNTNPNFVFSYNSRFTISSWVKFNSSATYQALGCFGNSATNSFFGALEKFSTNIRWAVGKSGVLTASATYPFSNITLGNWYLITGVYDNGVVSLYVNGNLVSSTSFSLTTTVPTATPIAIGSYYYSSTSTVANFLNGSLDQYRIYNRALSLSEIYTLFRNLNVSRPNGGEIFVIDQADTVKWVQTGLTGSVNVELNTNYPSGSWTSLGTVAASTGSLVWTPLMSQGSAGLARIRITSVTYPTIGDTSDANFGIYTAQTATNQGWIGNYPMDNTMYDYSLYGNHLSSTNLSYTTDRFNQTNCAASFNGTSGYSRRSNFSYVFNKPSTFTVSTWVKFNTSTPTQTILHLGNATTGYLELALDLYSTGVLRWAAANYSDQTISVQSNITAGQWNHVAGVYNQGQLTLYINGYSVGTTSYPYNATTSTSTPLTIGAYYYGGFPTNFMNGALDEMRLFNRALSAAEISYLATQIYLTNHNGGDVNVVDQANYVEWRQSGITGNVTVELNTNYPSGSWTVLGSAAASTGYYIWTPLSSQLTTNARIRITPVNYPSMCDTSNANFGVYTLQQALQTGLLAYYPFSGNTSDASGNGLTAINQGASWTTDRNGVANSAFSFNGSSSYVYADVGSAFSVSQVSISAWIKSTGPGTTSPRIAAVGPLNSTAQNYGLLLEGTGSPRRLWFYTNSSVTDVFSGSVFTNDNLWHHVVSVYDGSTVYLYLDGSMIAGAITTGAIPTFTSRRLQIGRSDYPTDAFQGSIDEVRFYNRALSDGEINALYSSIAISRPNGGEVFVVGQADSIKWVNKGLTGYVSVELNTNYPSGSWTSLGTVLGTTGYVTWTPQVSQLSTNARIRVMSTSYPSIGDTSDANFAVVTQSSMRFDGVSSYIDIQNLTILNQLPLTLEAWVKPEDVGSSINYANNILSNDDRLHYSVGFGVNSNSSQSYFNSNFHDGARQSQLSFPVGQWKHVAIVYSSGNVSSYVNGILYETYNFTQLIPDALTELFIGRYNPGTTESVTLFKGQVSDVRAWSTARTAQQIRENYNRRLTGMESGLVGYWPLSGSTGSPISDLASTHNGINYGAVVVGDAPPLLPLNLTSPNGGEVLIAGQTNAINWLQTGLTGNITIQKSLNYSTSGGSTWTNIATVPINDLTHTWTPAISDTSRTARIRITSVTNPTMGDTSEANFGIYSVQQAVQQGLVAYYPLNGNATDASGNGHTGTVNGATPSNDRYGTSQKAYSFNGSSNDIDLGNLGAIDNYSVSMWFKKGIANNYIPGGVAGSGSEAHLFGTQSTVLNNYYKFGFHESYRDRLYFALSPTFGNVVACYSNTSITDANWHHLVVVRNGSVLTPYLDGSVMTLTTLGWSSGDVSGTVATGTVTKLGTIGGATDAKFNGSIDETRIYSRALTLTEISALYQGIGISRPNGGDVFVVGQTDSVKWGQSGITGNVNVELNTNYPTGSWTSLGTVAASTGYITWTPLPAQLSSTARIRITSVTYPTIGDTSDGNFGIYNVQQAVQQGILAYYPLNGNANDASGNGHHGTPGGDLTSSANSYGTSNSAMHFDGSSANITVSSTTGLDATNITVSAWVKLDQYTGDNETVVARWHGGAEVFALEIDPTNHPQLVTNINSTHILATSSSTLPLGTWAHLCGTYNGQMVSLYVNGVLLCSSPFSGAFAPSTSPLMIGSQYAALDRNWTNGSIDEVRFYNRALSASEIQNLYIGMGISRPNGGETFTIGIPDTLKWGSTGITGNVRIELNRNYPSSTWDTLFASTPNDGSELWQPSGTVSSTARIRVTSIANPTVADTSDANFTIVLPPLVVTRPNGGEIFAIGIPDTIRWTQSGIVGNVSIKLNTAYPGGSWTTLATVAASQLYYVWTPTAPVSSNALVAITSVNNSGVTDSSNTIFSIVQPSLTVSRPNNLDTIYIGNMDTIRWTANYLPGTLTVKMNRNYPGGIWQTLSTTVPASQGWLDWYVAEPTANNVRVSILSNSYSSYRDTSDANSPIVYPSLRITRPVLGDTMLVNHLETIHWNAGHLPGNVTVKYNLNYPSGAWGTVVTNYPASTGEVNWSTNNLSLTNNFRIAITSESFPNIADTSSVNLVLATPFVSILHPNGGEQLQVGVPDTIRWATNINSTFILLMSRHGDNPEYFDILPGSDSIPSTQNMFIWTPTEPLSDSVRFYITDYAEPFDDYSDADCRIINGSLALTRPNGGETFFAGEVDSVKWTSSSLRGTVKIQINRNYPTGTWTTLDSLTNITQGYWRWNPVSLPVTGVARIRVVSNSNSYFADTSNAAFSIAARSISVVRPDGGESCYLNTVDTIRYTTQNLPNGVRIELNRNYPSTTWEVLTDSASSVTGYWLWNVSGAASATARIRCTGRGYTGYADTSNANFTIRPYPMSMNFSSINFSSVHVRTADSVQLKVWNTGNQAFRFTTLTGATSGMYSRRIMDTDSSTNTNDTLRIWVKFTPDSVLTYRDTLKFTFASPFDPITIPVAGLGTGYYVTLSRSSYNFALPIEPTLHDSISVIVRVAGNRPLLGGQWITLPSTAPFSTTSQLMPTVNAGDSSTVWVKFNPVTTGSFAAQVALLDSAINEDTIRISVSGTSSFVPAAPRLTVSLSGYDARLNWTRVDSSVGHVHLDTTLQRWYIVYFSARNDTVNANRWYFLGATYDKDSVAFIHRDVARFSPLMFYRVTTWIYAPSQSASIVRVLESMPVGTPEAVMKRYLSEAIDQQQ